MFVLSVSITLLYSQDADTVSNWKKGGIATLNFSQVSFSKYWAAGGENSLSGGAMLNIFANYEKDNLSWANSIDFGYGLIKQGDITKKSNDRIELNSQFGRKATEKLFYSGMMNFRTQFAPGYNYPNDSVVISRAFSPAYLTTSLGIEYKPSDKFNLFISPLTGKFTIVSDDLLSAEGAFGVDPGKKFRAELGGFLKVMYKTPVVTNVDLLTKADFFSNYLKNPQNIDVNMEVLLSMKINEYLSATINVLMIYDDDVKFSIDTTGDGIPDKKSPKTQLKEVFGLGFSYKF